MAAISASIRAIKNMALLGFATVRSLNDVITMSFTAKKDGIPWASIIKQVPRNFIDNFELPLLGIKPNSQKRKIASLIGLGPRALVADVHRDFPRTKTPVAGYHPVVALTATSRECCHRCGAVYPF